MKEQRIKIFSGFRGVDLSSSPLEVAPQHAVSMKNFLLKNGILRKRKGTLQIDKFDQSVNGVWEITIETIKYIIVHSGNKIYRMMPNQVTGRYDHAELTITNGNATTNTYITNTRSFGIVKKNKLYIACGDYLVFGKWTNGQVELRRVYRNEETYIPTTTISIDHDGISDYNRYVLDDINLLTPLRKNRLVGTTTSATYTLDSPIKVNTKVTIIGGIADGSTISYVNSNNGATYGTTLYDSGGNNVGSLVFATGKITLTANLAPALAENDNLTIEFEADIEDVSRNVTSCTIGSIFGTSSNRLFLGSSPEQPNVDWYSEADDFTYFSDVNFTSFGSSNSSIGAYLRLNDGTQAIIKYRAENEPSIYYRSIGSQPIYFDEYDGSTYVGQRLIGYKDIFPIRAGIGGIKLASKYACQSLNGDNLILLDNGVNSIQLVQNIATDERITIQRGKNIQRVLMNANLSEATGYVFENKYFLSVGENCYVADGNYWADGTNYEWVVLNKIDARLFFLLGEKLHYADQDNRIIEMFTDKFIDSKYLYGGLTAQASSVFYVDDDYSISEGNKALITGSNNLYELIADNLTLEASGLSYDHQALPNDIKVFVDGVADTGLLINTEYTLSYFNETLTFKLYLAGVLQTISGDVSGLKILRVINNRMLNVDDIVETTIGETAVKTFKLYENQRQVIIYSSANYELPATATEVYFYDEKPVICDRYSGITDLGEGYIAKTIIALYCTPEQLPFGTMSIGLKTYTSNQAYSITNSGTFRFSDIVFSNFKFSSIEFPSGFKTHLMERDKNFIQFKVESTTDRDCGINNYGVKYILNREIKGVE